MTVAPEIPGALELIAWLADRGVAVSWATPRRRVAEARAGYAAGGRTTTHLFNGMTRRGPSGTWPRAWRR